MATVKVEPVDGAVAPITEHVEQKEKGGFGFPHPITFLGLIIFAVWLLTLVIPAGTYDRVDGRPVAGSFHTVASPLDFRGHVANLLLSPINGLYGIRGADSGQVGPFQSGSLFGGAQVFLFILAIGAFMTVVFQTGALDLGIGHLAHSFRTRGPVLIIVMSVLFGVLGSVMTWSDETLGFYALLLPLMLALGYDRMVTVAVVSVAPFVGAIGSTVTPFRIGVGSDAAGVSIGDGIVLRLLLFVLTLGAMIVYTLRYAARVKADPSRSLVPIEPGQRFGFLCRGWHVLIGSHRVRLQALGFDAAIGKTLVLPGADDGPGIEPVWQLPLHRPYGADLYAGVADLRNIGDDAVPDAIVAAPFLSHFVGGIPWAHLDIAGPAQHTGERGWHTDGPSGFGARLLLDLALGFTPTRTGAKPQRSTKSAQTPSGRQTASMSARASVASTPKTSRRYRYRKADTR